MNARRKNFVGSIVSARTFRTSLKLEPNNYHNLQAEGIKMDDSSILQSVILVVDIKGSVSPKFKAFFQPALKRIIFD